MSNQKANVYLKLLGQMAGLHDIVHITEYRDNRRIDMALPKYKCLSTHAGRRTFVTSAIAAGIPPTVVMSFTGHKTYAVMERYIGIASDTKDKAIKELDSYLGDRAFGIGPENQPFPFFRISSWDLTAGSEERRLSTLLSMNSA